MNRGMSVEGFGSSIEGFVLKVKQKLVQIGRLDGPIENLSKILAGIKWLLPQP